MGSGSSRMGSHPSHGKKSMHRRRHTISSLLICGASSSREMEDYPAELRVNSVEHGDQEKLKFMRNASDLSLGAETDVAAVKTQISVSSGRCTSADKNPAPEVCQSNFGPGDKGKCLYQSRELVPFCQLISNSGGNETASTSYVDGSSPDCISETEMAIVDAVNGINNSMNEDPSQIVLALSNSNGFPSHGLRESFLNEISAEKNVSEAIDFSNSEHGSASIVSNSPIEFDLPRDDGLQGVLPPPLGFLVSEREQNRQVWSLMHGSVTDIASNILSPNSAEISIREARRNSRRLFWDAFSRRSSRRGSDSGSSVFSSNDSEHFRSHDRLLLDFSGDFFSEELRGEMRTHRSRIQGTNEQQWESGTQIWDRLRDSPNTTDPQTAVCPRGIHADGSCSCQSGLSAEESGTRAGISRIVLLAQALFEVLDQIHHQPTSFSMSMVSLPAPESVVDSFPVKTSEKEERSECADDISQCYICLAEYEDGDKIRVLPCYHEYHMLCVDKWLKEIHGVCPLCRGDVREGFTETSVSNEEILSH